MQMNWGTFEIWVWYARRDLEQALYVVGLKIEFEWIDYIQNFIKLFTVVCTVLCIASQGGEIKLFNSLYINYNQLLLFHL